MAEEKGVWRTVAGRRIFIKDGESLSDSMKRSGKFKGSLSKTKTINKKDKLKDSEDDSYAYKKNWSKEDAEKYIASQLKNNEGHDSVLLEKNGHYAVANNWKEAETAIKKGWKHEKEDVDKIRRMAGLDKSNDEKQYSNGRTEKTYDSKKEKKPVYGRKAVKLDDLQKEVAEFSKDLDQDKWAKQMREDYVKQVYYAHARELMPVPHKGSDGKEYVYGNDDMNEYRIETSYLSSSLRGDLAGWYNNATRVNSRAPREWQSKVDKLVKDKFVNTYGTWEDYQASKKKKK